MTRSKVKCLARRDARKAREKKEEGEERRESKLVHAPVALQVTPAKFL